VDLGPGELGDSLEERSVESDAAVYLDFCGGAMVLADLVGPAAATDSEHYYCFPGEKKKKGRMSPQLSTYKLSNSL
jgi:hypothetical protein